MPLQNKNYLCTIKLSMKDSIKRLRLRGLPAQLAATLLIILVLTVQSYLSIHDDEEEARKLVNRELVIVEQHIMSELKEAEFSMDDMHDAVIAELEHPENLDDITRTIMEDNSLLKGAAIAFIPNFYPEKGYWYEPRSYRQGKKIITEELGGPNHDYTQMDWYLKGLTNNGKHGYWSKPYMDHSQNDIYVMSLTLPLHQGKKVVAVLCLDIELTWIKKILKDVEPYPGSICKLLDKSNEVLVTTSDTNINEEDFFIDSNEISYSNMVIQLACPKKAIYGDSTLLNLTTFGLLFLGMLLLTYIVRHTIKNINHLTIAQQQQQMIDREMRIAHDIQMDILRHHFPEELSAVLLPMKEVGGDLYDFYKQDDTLYFIIGDVSGKGLPAHMQMAATVNLFRMAARHYSTPADIMTEINQILSDHNPSLMFVTAFIGKIDLQHGLLTYCNAGHNPPIVNNTLLKSDPDIPLGYQEDFHYKQYGFLFPEGSRIVLYTDGITEARNEQHELMGVKRLCDTVKDHYTESLEDLLTNIVNDTRQFAGQTERIDDMTLMCITNNRQQQSPSLIITNEIEELQRVKSLLREYCDCLGCERRLTSKILLAVEEAVANCMNYAYPKGIIGCIDIDIQAMPATSENQQGDLTIRILDNGEPFDPTSRQEVDVEQAASNRQVGGLGIYLYLQLMDHVYYERTDDGHNLLIMTKTINYKS